jgi:hypothetical protein
MNAVGNMVSMVISHVHQFVHARPVLQKVANLWWERSSNVDTVTKTHQITAQLLLKHHSLSMNTICQVVTMMVAAFNNVRQIGAFIKMVI